MAINDYRDLTVWQKAIDLSVEIYRLTKELPKDEMYGITSQMRRASVSIPSNIAEGNYRNSTKEYLQFLAIAQGSRAELETQLLLCTRLGYLAEEKVKNARNLIYEVARMLTTLTTKLKDSHTKK